MDYPTLQFETRPKEFHSNENIKFGLLVSEGLITLGVDPWNWEAYNDEQKARIIEQMKRKFFDYELNAPPHVWRLNFIQALVETQAKYNPLYKVVEQGFNPLYNLDEWEKQRDINSDFPQTRIPNTANNDYASEGLDMERELIRIADPIENIVKLAEVYKDVDTLFLNDIEHSCFSCVIVSHVNALY